MADTPLEVKVSVTDLPEFMSILATSLSLYESIYRSPVEWAQAMPPGVVKAYMRTQKAVELWREKGLLLPGDDREATS